MGPVQKQKQHKTSKTRRCHKHLEQSFFAFFLFLFKKNVSPYRCVSLSRSRWGSCSGRTRSTWTSSCSPASTPWPGTAWTSVTMATLPVTTTVSCLPRGISHPLLVLEPNLNLKYSWWIIFFKNFLLWLF